jgi:hypothetical protein
MPQQGYQGGQAGYVTQGYGYAMYPNKPVVYGQDPAQDAMYGMGQRMQRRGGGEPQTQYVQPAYGVRPVGVQQRGMSQQVVMEGKNQSAKPRAYDPRVREPVQQQQAQVRQEEGLRATHQKYFVPDYGHPPGCFNIVGRGGFPSIDFPSEITSG